MPDSNSAIAKTNKLVAQLVAGSENRVDALNTQSTFDIRNFTESLTPSKEKNKYICPVCEGHNLSVNPKDGKYQCFNGCACEDIRETIKPWDEVLAERRQSNPTSKKPSSAFKKPQEPILLPSGELAIATLAETPIDIPQPAKPQFVPKSIRKTLFDKGVTQQQSEQISVTTYSYEGNKASHRYEAPCTSNAKGYEKTFAINRVDEQEKTHWNKGNYAWAAYRQAEAIAAIQSIPNDEIPVLLSHEGEKCVEAGRSVKLAGITSLGNAGLEDLVCILGEIKSKLGDRQFIVAHLQDNDPTGSQKAEKLARAAARCDVPFVAVDLKAIKPDLCNKGDIVDVLASGMSGEELAAFILEEIRYARLDQEGHGANNEDFSQVLNPNVAFNQQAVNFLFGDKPWISADDRLYYWNGNHYKYSPDSVERPKIASYCNSYVVFVETSKGIQPTYPCATPAKVEEVLRWIKMRVEINPDLLNPPGINCSNGVVGVKWETGKPVRYIEPHDPTKHYFTYEPLVKYDPKADITDCDRLLQCLDEPQQQVLLRNLAASIDLSEVRKRRGREVKILLACGLGSNGKDALRQTVSTIFGHSGMTSVSLADFSHYDDGRKFALAPLLYSRINWASENPQTARLDKIQSLKLFATGNVLHSERKGKDHIEFIPKAVGIFNLNDVPALQGTIQAIQDRIAPLEFRKTFKSNPNPDDPNELQADPRFAYDDDFVRTSVAPAFLNKMLDALETLISEGINYECTTDAFKSMQKENNHLLQFCEDIGLDYNPSGAMSAMDIWAALEEWYINNGTLTVEDDGKRRIWAEQARPSDKTIKAPNQIIARFKQLFPKAKLATTLHPSGKKSVQVLQGISIITQVSTPVEVIPTPVPPQSPPQQTLINQDFHPNHPSFTNIGVEEKKNQPCISSSNSISPKVEQNSSKLGWDGCDPDAASILGVENGVELGWENPPNEVENGVKNESEPAPRKAPPQSEEPISLFQVEADGCDVEIYMGCQLEVRSLNGQTKFTGVMTGWDEKHGIVSVMTSGGEKQAYFRETFVVG